MAKAYYEDDAPMDGRTRQTQRQRNADIARTRGTGETPEAPRDLQWQAGSRGGLLTWKLPYHADGIVGWRIYKNTERELLEDIHDVGVRQKYVDLTAGTTPPVVNLFVSSVNAAGMESAKVQIQVSASAEASAPAVPSAPPGYTDEAAGGGDTDMTTRHGNTRGWESGL